jgi:hypothetical protein
MLIANLSSGIATYRRNDGAMSAHMAVVLTGGDVSAQS